jgi:hypothetical protein
MLKSWLITIPQKRANTVIICGIAGIVIIWVLLTHFETDGCLNEEWLHISFLLFVITITVSLVHYSLLAALSDRLFHKNAKDLKQSINIEDLRKVSLDDNKTLEVLSWIFFYTKLIVLIIAYLITIAFVFVNFFEN